MSLKTKNFVYLLVFALLTYLVGNQMKKWVSSQEVVAFEFIKTGQNADAILSSQAWKTPDKEGNTKIERLKINTYLDFLYILCYVSFFISLARVLIGSTHPKTSTLTTLLVIAGGADVIENLCLLQILNGARGFYPGIMYGLAVIKFGLLLLYLLWLISIIVQRFLRK
jgi:hypothetical protein